MLQWCLAFGMPTEGLKVPEMKASSVRFRSCALTSEPVKHYERSLFRATTTTTTTTTRRRIR